MKKDNNKQITQIDYNYLKLPEQITLTGGRWIKYDYDADGVKLRKTLSTGKVTDYEEDDIYEDGVLYQTAHDEGRIVGGIYEYNITDHLGNLRVAFKDSLGIAKITQVNAYGVFGDDLPTLRYINSLKKNRFTFQEQEIQDDFGLGWYQYKWRMEDPVIGRFISIDPLAEKYVHNSTFAFSENKVTSHRELEGLEAVYVFDQATNPNNKRVYTAEIYVRQDNGKVTGPYRGSSYPNNANTANTVNTGTSNYNNESGHKGGTKKGLNLVDDNDNRNSPGTSPEGDAKTMSYVNVHSGVKPEDNNGNQNRGSAGCITCHPDDAANLFSNFDFSDASGNTGNAQGTITIFRGETPESVQAKKSLTGTPALVLPQVVIQPDATSVVKPEINIIKPKK